MNLKIYGAVFLLVLMLVNPLAWAMEQPANKSKTLSLKFMAAQQAYTDFRKSKDNKNLSEYLKTAPEEVKEYVGLFELLDQEMLKFVMTVYQHETVEKKCLAYSILKKRFFKIIDRGPEQYNRELQLLTDLNSNNLTREEKNSIAQVFLHTPDSLKEERWAFTRLLQKAIKNNRLRLVYFLAANGAYLNKPDHTDQKGYKPIFTALKVGSLPIVDILFTERVKKAVQKDPEACQKSMKEFLTACVEDGWATTLLSVALATGNIDLMDLLFNAVEETGLNLWSFLNFKDPATGRTALFAALWRGDDVCKEFPVISGMYSVQESKRELALMHFFKIAADNNFDLAELFNAQDCHEESLLAYTTDEHFPFLLQLAARYQIDLEKFINSGSNVGCALTILTREDGHEALELLLEFAGEHACKLEGIQEALDEAVYDGNVKAIQLFADRGLPVNLNQLLNRRDENNRTFAMCLTHNFRGAKKLRQLMNLADRNNITLRAMQECVEEAIVEANFPVLELLVQRGVIPDLETYLTSTNSFNNRNPLVKLVHRRTRDYRMAHAIEGLLQFAEQHNITIPTALEALTIARELGYVDIIEVLLPKLPELDIAQFLNEPDTENNTLLMRLMKATDWWRPCCLSVKLVELAKNYHVILERVPEALAIAQEDPELNKEIIELLEQLAQPGKCE